MSLARCRWLAGAPGSQIRWFAPCKPTHLPRTAPKLRKNGRVNNQEYCMISADSSKGTALDKRRNTRGCAWSGRYAFVRHQHRQVKCPNFSSASSQCSAISQVELENSKCAKYPDGKPHTQGDRGVKVLLVPPQHFPCATAWRVQTVVTTGTD